MSCVESAQSSILWNGEPLDPIFHRCGLRQGDPLSPYLFVLCMERLSYMIDEAVQSGGWDPAVIGRRGPSISHMFFADDIILTAKNTPKSAMAIKNTLDLFCNASATRRIGGNQGELVAIKTIGGNQGELVAIKAAIKRQSRRIGGNQGGNQDDWWQSRRRSRQFGGNQGGIQGVLGDH
ncbi:hypothetical protein BUALT_Bualt05G0044800 [Buddleja alternifolia]|uniref:Reverse transcriptase domain-containing protein n=1 Tax=Buddleja alternifolia TaxID=168488 RepID=A0AAV6XGL3_9LAMI|nr:hypothetical protein BUALT_Bualt05G0044800 [Buddleja alternifolia]